MEIMMAIIYEFNWVQYVSATTYAKLREENKKLKEEVKELRKNWEYYHRDNCQLRDEIMKCKEVNWELNEEIEKLKDIQSWKVVCLWWFGV